MKLKTVEIHLKFSPRDIIMQGRVPVWSSRYFKTVKELRSKGIYVLFFFNGNRIDMDKEVMPLRYLRPSFTTTMLLAGRNFSDLNLEAVVRWRSPLEHRFFVQHGVDYFDLLNRPTFDARFWVNTAFFKAGGKRNRYFQCQSSQSNADTTGNISGKEVCELRRQKIPLYGDISGTAFTFRYEINVDKVLDYNVLDVASLLDRLVFQPANTYQPDPQRIRQTPRRTKFIPSPKERRKLAVADWPIRFKPSPDHCPADFDQQFCLNGGYWHGVKWRECLQPHVYAPDNDWSSEMFRFE